MSKLQSDQLSFLKQGNYSGVANVIQTVKEDDILLLPCRSHEQQSALLKSHLPNDFRGLLISPFISEEIPHLKKNIQEIKELETLLIDHFYPFKNRPLLFGVTGTNGKTSVSWLISEIAKVMKKKCLYMGTPGIYCDGQKLEEEVLTTTPSYLDIRKTLFNHGEGVDILSLELSSHALEQGRLRDLSFDSIGWTNFTQDHLDFHKTMDSYFDAKMKILNIAKKNEISLPKNQSDLHKKIGQRAYVRKSVSLENLNIAEKFKSGFTQENLEVALGMLSAVYPIDEGLDLSSIELPPGRMQVIDKNEKIFVVDYAHTPDALEKALVQVKKMYQDKEIITVFGCGGDRDRLKRPLMGKIASEKSDIVIVTSDNPRTEDPSQIINDILEGIDKDAKVEVERQQAIELANKLSDSKSVVLIAGKGHENYQEVDGVKHPFDDAEIVRGLK